MAKRRLSLTLVLSLMMGFVVAGNVSAADAVGLGTAGPFAVLAGSAVTNTGPSVINGDLGVDPSASVSGFPPGIVNGVIHADDAVALQAQSDLTTAYNNVAGQACNTDLTDQDLGGLTLTEGVYCFDEAAGLTGTLTLDAEHNPDALFLFQVGEALTTASSSIVSLTNGAQACNVFWKIGSSATLGSSTDFVGNILALTSISLTTGADIDGRALARNGAVTLDTNVITRATCDDSDTTECTSTLNGGTYTAIEVPDGAICKLIDVTVEGDVDVGQNSRLGTSEGTQIGGDVVAVKARSVHLIDTDIAGDVELQYTKGQIVIGSDGCAVDPIVGGRIRILDSWGTVAVCQMSVGRSIIVKRSHAAVGLYENVVTHNLIVTGTRGYGLWIGGNTVGGYVLDSNNRLTSHRHFVRGNTIAGELRCFVNSPNPVHARNTVGGLSRGECAP